MSRTAFAAGKIAKAFCGKMNLLCAVGEIA
jgi:hypothetical protein